MTTPEQPGGTAHPQGTVDPYGPPPSAPPSAPPPPVAPSWHSPAAPPGWQQPAQGVSPSGPYAWQQPAPAGGGTGLRPWHWALIGGGVLVGLLVLAGITVAGVLLARDAGPTAASPSGAGEAQGVGVFDIGVGDCLGPTSEERLAEVAVVPCDAAHASEVFHVATLPDDAYPGEASFDESVGELCEPAFEAYVGTPYDESTWWISTIHPTEESWGAGDRELVCLLETEDYSETTGSARDTAA